MHHLNEEQLQAKINTFLAAKFAKHPEIINKVEGSRGYKHHVQTVFQAAKSVLSPNGLRHQRY